MEELPIVDWKKMFIVKLLCLSFRETVPQLTGSLSTILSTSLSATLSSSLPALLVGGRGFSVVYNTWHGFFFSIQLQFQLYFLSSILFKIKLGSYVSNVAKHDLGKDWTLCLWYSANWRKMTSVGFESTIKYAIGNLWQ